MKLNSYQATYFLNFQKLSCFGGFIVTTFIMLILIENWLIRLPALHYSVDFIFLSFGIMGFIVELWNY